MVELKRKSPRSAEALVGREEILGRLRWALEHVGMGGQAFIELVGEPGIGKTAVLSEGLSLGRHTGFETVSCTGGELLTNVPYAMITPLLRALGIHLDSDDQPDSTRSRSDLHRAVRRGLSGRATTEPIVLGFDDVHWADQPSLELLARLLHDPPAIPLLVVVAYRGRQEPAVLAEMSRLLAPSVSHMRLPVRPLSLDEFGLMLGLEANEHLTDIHARAGGNPLYGLALAAQPGDVHGKRLTGGLTDVSTSQTVVRALRAEFSGLEGCARSILDTAAVAGDGFNADVVAAASGVPDDEAAAALEILVARDLVREDDSHPSVWRFRHPVLRALVYRELSSAKRRSLHGRLAEVMRDRGAGQVLLAVHVARSAEPGDLAATELLVASAEQVGAYAPGTAIEYLESARSLSGGRTLGAGLRVRMDLNLARAYMWAGKLAAAREILQAGPPPDAEPQDRMRYTLARARAERLMGRHLEAQAIVRAELSTVGPQDSAFEVMLALEGALAGAMCGSDSAVFLDHAQRAVRHVTDKAFHVVVKIFRGFVTAMWGGDPVALEELGSAALAVDALPDGHLVHLMDPLGLLAWAEIQLERDHDALRHFNRALAIANRAGHVDLLPLLLVGRSYVTSRLGGLVASAEDAEDAVDAARTLGIDAVLGLALNFLAAVRGYLDGPHAAIAAAEEAVSVMPPGGRQWLAEVAQRTSVRIRHAAGDPFDAVAALTKACGGADMTLVEVATRPYWCAVLAELSLASGRLDAAAGWIGKGFSFAHDDLPGATAHVTLARARHDASTGDFASAQAHAANASETFNRLGWVPAEIVSRRLLASLHGKLRAWDAMFAELAEARRLAEATGSGWLRQAVIAEQRRLASAAGISPASRPSPFAELSRREMEIALLAADGATNTEIAAKLHVTVKTVEAHLSRVYRKLGVRSRAMLAGALPATGRDAG